MTDNTPLQNLKNEIFRDKTFHHISSWKWSSFFRVNELKQTIESSNKNAMVSSLILNIKNMQTIKNKSKYILNKNIAGIRQSDLTFHDTFTLENDNDGNNGRDEKLINPPQIVPKRKIEILYDDDDESDDSDDDNDIIGIKINQNITMFNIMSNNSTLKILVNQSLYPVELHGNTYSTGEHAYQSEKFFHVSKYASDSRQSALIHHAHKIKSAKTPQEAKLLGSESSFQLTDIEIEKWNNEKEDIQEKICRYKYENYNEVKHILQNTTDYLLYNDNTKLNTVSYWGGHINPKTKRVIGKNKLGYIWMKIRSQIANEKVIEIFDDAESEDSEDSEDSDDDEIEILEELDEIDDYN